MHPRLTLRDDIRQSRPFRNLAEEATLSVVRTFTLIRRAVAAVVEPAGITPAQYNVLRILRGAGPAGLPTLTVRDRMVDEAPGITRLIDKLELAGFVRRERAVPDRRQVFCTITPKGLALLKRLDLARTLFCVISKSGTTVETLAQYALVRTAIERDHRQPAKHLAFVTGPEAGPLRDIATRDKIPTFDIPTNVGGRFSVLTPVGTLPAAFAGFDTSALLAGAREMRDRCAGGDLATNPAGVFAIHQWRSHTKAAQCIHVMMSYADALRDIPPWFVQLWAESLGKVDADGRAVGPTPVAARGATDQHSQLQLYMEGPADKTVAFLVERERRADLKLPAGAALAPPISHLKGHTLGELLDAEQRATADALASVGRPSLTIGLDVCDAHHVGALIMLLMKATIYAGALYRVNPLDQPGVELGKRLAREALASPKRSTSDSRWTV